MKEVNNFYNHFVVMLSCCLFFSTLSCSKSDTQNPNLKIHNQDAYNFENETEIIKGEYVLFLRPNDKKFELLRDEPGIFEVDSDFGFAISNTIDSLKSKKQEKNIKYIVSTKRYIEIENCKKCPVKIDRDSILYGIILTSPSKEVQIINGIGTLNYFSFVDQYFNK